MSDRVLPRKPSSLIRVEFHWFCQVILTFIWYRVKIPYISFIEVGNIINISKPFKEEIFHYFQCKFSQLSHFYSPPPLKPIAMFDRETRYGNSGKSSDSVWSPRLCHALAFRECIATKNAWQKQIRNITGPTDMMERALEFCCVKVDNRSQ